MAQNGWASLGEILASAGTTQDNAYRRRLGENLTLGTRGENLAQEQMKTRALQTGVYDAAIANGATPEQATLFAANAQGNAGSDYAATMRGLGSQLENNLRQAAVDAARGGDWAGANANMLGVASGPQDLAKIESDTLLGNVLVPGGDMRGPTAIGDKKIERLGSQMTADLGRASQSNAAAELSRVRAAAGGYAPRSGSGGGGGKPPAFTQPSQGSTALVLGDAAGKIDRTRFDDFQTWRQAHPELRNGEEALASYVAQAGGAGGGPDGDARRAVIIDPTLPGSMTKSPPTRLGSVFAPAVDDQTAAKIEVEIGRRLSQDERQQIADGTFDLRLPVKANPWANVRGSSNSTESRTPAPHGPAPPAKAIAMLRADPTLRPQFEAKYGVAAAQFLPR